jgi:hypothetical protein
MFGLICLYFRSFSSFSFPLAMGFKPIAKVISYFLHPLTTPLHFKAPSPWGGWEGCYLNFNVITVKIASMIQMIQNRVTILAS